LQLRNRHHTGTCRFMKDYFQDYSSSHLWNIDLVISKWMFVHDSSSATINAYSRSLGTNITGPILNRISLWRSFLHPYFILIWQNHSRCLWFVIWFEWNMSKAKYQIQMSYKSIQLFQTWTIRSYMYQIHEKARSKSIRNQIKINNFQTPSNPKTNQTIMSIWD
jgi:hypothetical protein